MVEFKLYTRMPRQCVPKIFEVFDLPRVLLVESSSQPIDVKKIYAESPTDGTIIQLLLTLLHGYQQTIFFTMRVLLPLVSSLNG